jgi:ferredoxin
MAVITFYNEHRSVEADAGNDLRKVMRRVGVTPYRGFARLTNCRGHNLCGTCAVEIVDGKGGSPRTQDEERTLGGNLLVVHTFEKSIRLACQTRITGDMTVKTFPSRPIDRKSTKQRMVLAGIALFFLLAFLGTFGFLFMDMIKRY